MASKAELGILIRTQQTGQKLLSQHQAQLAQLGKFAKEAAPKLEGMAGAIDKGTEAAKGAHGVVGGLVDQLGRLGLAALGVGAVKSLVGSMGSVVTAASDMAESASKAQVVFGDSFGSIAEFAEESATSMGLPKRAALEMAGTFGNLLTSMGLSRTGAAFMSKNIIKLGADLASFNNIPVEDALEKLRAGLVGESEPLRSLGVNLSEAAVEEQAFAMGLAKSKGELTDSMKVQARYALIMKQSENAVGDFARTSTGMANSTKIISANFANLKVQVGQTFLPIVAKLTSAFASALPSAMAAVAPLLDRAGATFERLASSVGVAWEWVQRFYNYFQAGNTFDLMGTLFGPSIGPKIDEVVRGLGTLLGTVTEFAGKLIPAIQAIAAGDLDFSEFASDWLGAFGDAFGGMGARIGELLGTVGASIDWGALWQGAGDIMGKAGELIGSVGAWLGETWAAIDWVAVWRNVTTLGSSLAAGVGSIWGSVTAWLGEQWSRINWAEIWAFVQRVGEGFEEAVPPAVANFQRWAQKSVEGIDWSVVWQSAKNADQAFASAIDSWDLTPVGRALGKKFTDMLGAMPWTSLIVAGIAVPVVIQSLPGRFLDAVFGNQTVKAIARGLAEISYGFGSEVITNLVQGVKDNLPSWLAALGGMLAAAQEWFDGTGVPNMIANGLAMGAGLGRGLQNAIRAIRLPLPNIRLWWEQIATAVGNLSIPHLELSIDWKSLSELIPEAKALGGLVAAAKPYLVGERGPELFMPQQAGRILSAPETTRALAGARAGGNQTVNITLHVAGSVLAEDELLRQVRDGLSKWVQRNGRMAFG